MIISDQPGLERLSLRTFGELTIRLGADSPPLRFETRTTEALLIYLACQGRPLGRDALAELLWPERTQEQARANLSVALHRLRRQLAPYLLVTRQSVALNPDAHIELDVTQLEEYLAAGRLTAATALYTGDFLDGFYLRDSPAFEHWVLLERERLRTLALAAYQQLIDQSIVAGQPSAAITSAQRLLQLDPLHEPTHRQLMRLLAQTGQRSAAFTQYETCRHLLTTELDAPPDEMTTALMEQIRAGDLRITRPEGTRELRDHGTDEPILVNPKSKIVNLPPQPTPFIGRSAELAQIARLLANPDCRLLTLLGIGGIGKTRLALEAATRTVDFTDGLCFVALAPLGDPALLTSALAQSLGVQPTSSDPRTEIAAYLRLRTLLLVLDNFEHLLDDTDKAIEVIAYLLQQAPQLKVLVTSRVRLALREEWLLPVAGLALAADLTGDAEQLFLHSAQRVSPEFTGQDQEAAIAAICRQVEGMPLALELAASWVRVMACDAIVRQMQADFDFLTSPLRNLPERHRSVRALFDHSWCLLTPVEQGVLMRLSVFRGGWQLEEAAPVTGATLALLRGLVDKSLVRANGQQRFDLHELVRQYAAEQLVASGEDDLIRQRHYAAYLQLFRTADRRSRGPEAATWLARLLPEQDNVRAAMQWAFDQVRHLDAAWLIIITGWFWNLHGYWVEYGRWLARLLPHRQTLPPPVHLTILIYVYSVARSVEEFQPVVRWQDEVTQLLELCPDKVQQAAVWHFWASFATDYAEAGRCWARSIDLARAADESMGLGPEFGLVAHRSFVLDHSLWSYAERLISRGELAQAVPLSQEALALCQARGSGYETVDSLGNLGRVALLQGDLAQAHKVLHEAVTLAAAYNYRNMLCLLQPILGITTLYTGDPTEAQRLLTEGLRFCQELNNKFFLGRVCTYLAEVTLWRGELVQTEQWLAQSLAYHANPRSVTIYQVDRFWVAARLATAQQQYQRAATLFGLADQIHSQVYYAIAGPMRTLADTALATVQGTLGLAAFAEAFTAGQQMTLEAAFAMIVIAESNKG